MNFSRSIQKAVIETYPVRANCNKISLVQLSDSYFKRSLLFP
jgi:hypothetical protein